MGKNKIKISKLVCALSIASMSLFLTACSVKGIAKAALNKGEQIIEEKIDEANSKQDEECREILEEKAELYGIDPEGVLISSGGTYLKVPVDTIHSYEDMESHIGNFRRWLRFAYAEMPRSRYFVSVNDRNDLDIWYGGFSEQDYGYDSEYYWDDEYILSSYAQHLVDNAREEDKSAEKFYEITGIDEDTAIAIRSRVIQTYPSFNIEEPDKNEHTYTFIPGDTIMHCEKFVIGDEECPIEAGVYNVDLPDDHGIIHITDSNDNTIYRLDAKYRYGHTDEIYNYEMLPVKVELKKGNIIYMTNATSTFDSCVE